MARMQRRRSSGARVSFLDELAGELGSVAREAVASGGVRVFVKTNLGPELAVTGGGSGLFDALGIKAGVIVRDKHGNTLASHGGYPATDPLKVALLVAVAGALGFILLRGVLRR